MVNLQNVQKLCQIILQSTTPLIKESDLRHFTGSDNFADLIRQTVAQFSALGLTLIRTTYLGEKYYVLTGAGKDEKVSPSMYGVLVSILALYNEIGSNLGLLESKRIFKEVWEEVTFLLELNYLAEIEENDTKKLTITPLGKAACKNIGKDINLQSLLQSFTPSD
ncbi:MAG: hypothetical protein ACTSVZ_03875 [Promethearchaeota archaeon]